MIPLLLSMYCVIPLKSCFWLFMQPMSFALSRALDSAGRSIAAKIAMIAITTRSSIIVKIFIFSLQGKNIEQGTLKDEVEKHLNNGTFE